MCIIGQKLHEFKLDGFMSDFLTISNESLISKWAIIFTYPRNFTFICPTEVVEMNDLSDEFSKINCAVYGLSTDSKYSHKAWIESLKINLKYPLLSDTSHEFCAALNILNKSGDAYRATIIIDPDNKIRYFAINDMSVGRNSAEILRIVQALKTGELCGCSWVPGNKTLGKA